MLATFGMEQARPVPNMMELVVEVKFRVIYTRGERSTSTQPVDSLEPILSVSHVSLCP